MIMSHYFAKVKKCARKGGYKKETKSSTALSRAVKLMTILEMLDRNLKAVFALHSIMLYFL
jgi:hypothetical protein